MSSFFLGLDIFGTKPRFTINMKKGHKTYYGALLTLFISCALVFFFFYFISKIFIHQKPESLITTTYTQENPDKYIFNNNFILAISLQYENYTQFIDETIYTMNAIETTYKLENGNFIATERKIDFVLCSNYTFNTLNDYFSSLNIDNLYCVNLTNHYLQGEYGQEYWTYHNLLI